VYRAHSCLDTTFLNKLQIIIQHFRESCPIIITGDFNVDIPKEITMEKINNNYLDFMDKFKLKSQFSESITKVGSQLNHIWANVTGNECKSFVI
jgi:hypothetical protein